MTVKDVDVCIVTYNRKDRLEKTINILSNQTNKNFNLIINDDGSKEIIDPNSHSIITKYIWNKDDGYHRVLRYNECVLLSVSPHLILLDDDCIPSSENFIESHLNLLEEHDVVTGKIRFPDGGFASGWFSCANLSIRKKVIEEIGFYDMGYDGSYGHEDQDYGNILKKHEYKIVDGNSGTIVDHGHEIYANGDRSDRIIGKNTRYFISKWGYDPR
jgi:glycosyltransferase involved in cell wall biosynthesis